MKELIRNATIEDFKRGYIWNNDKGEFRCLICQKVIGKDNIIINNHMSMHGTPIERLLMLDKKYTGLTEVEMGIIQIYNKVNGYSFVDISSNLYKPFESIKFKLNLGKIRIKNFQEDWNKYGEDAFEFIVVEKLKKKENSTDKEALDDLKELLNLWIDSQGDNLKLYNK